jgi:hypothetical protein
MLAAVIVQQRRPPRSPGFSVSAPGLVIPVCAAGAALMAGFALFQPLWVQSGTPLEWKLIAVWAAPDFIIFLREKRRPSGQRGIATRGARHASHASHFSMFSMV